MSKVQDSKVMEPVLATAITTSVPETVAPSSSSRKNNHGTGSNNIAIINRASFPPRKPCLKNAIVSNWQYRHHQHSKFLPFPSHHSHTSSHNHYHPYRLYHSHQIPHSSQVQVRSIVAPQSNQPTTSRSGTTTTPTTSSAHEAVTKKNPNPSSKTVTSSTPTSSSVTKMAPLEERRGVTNNFPGNNLLTSNNNSSTSIDDYHRDTPTNELIPPGCNNYTINQGHHHEGMKRISPYPNHHFQNKRNDGHGYSHQQQQPPAADRYHHYHQHHHEDQYQCLEGHSAGPHPVATDADTPLRSNQSSRPPFRDEETLEDGNNGLYISNSQSQDDEYDSNNYYSSIDYYGHHHQQPESHPRFDRGWRSGPPHPGYPQVNGKNLDWFPPPPHHHHQQQHYHQYRPREYYYYPTAPPPLMTVYSSDATEDYHHDQHPPPPRHPYELWQEGSEEVIPPPDDGSYYSQYHHPTPAFLGGPHGHPPLQEYNHHSKMMMTHEQTRREGPDGHDEEEDEKNIITPRTPSSSQPSAGGEGYPRKVTPLSGNNATPGSDSLQGRKREYDSPVVTGVNVASPERDDGTISSREAVSTASTPLVSNTSKTTGNSIGGNSPVRFVTLQDQDVVCGRGAPTEYHIGNAHFRDLVRSYHTSYFCAKRSDKPQIAMKVLDILETRGARFVRREKATRVASPGGTTSTSSASSWVVVSRKLAYEKVCQSLRDGAPEVQRQMLSSSQKIREAINRERTNEARKHPKGPDDQQHEQYYHAIESNGSMTDHSDYSNVVASTPQGPGDHDKENGYPPRQL